MRSLEVSLPQNKALMCTIKIKAVIYVNIEVPEAKCVTLFEVLHCYLLHKNQVYWVIARCIRNHGEIKPTQHNRSKCDELNFRREYI